MATGELVALGDLALLSNVHAHEAIDPGRQLIALVAIKDTHTDDLAGFTVGHLQ